LHRHGLNPALLQPLGHLPQFAGGAPETPHRLAIPVRWDGHVVRFVADIDARGIGMDHFQAKVVALDLPHRLPPLLAVHLVPAALHGSISYVFALLR
jgi:hypothetical protein